MDQAEVFIDKKHGAAFDNMFKGTTPDDINFEGKVKVSELKTRIKEIIKSKVGEGFKDYLGYSEKTEEFPKTLEGEGYGIVFRKIEDLRDGRAKYEAWFEDFKNIKKLDTFVFGSRKELDMMAQDYILPKGATQSSQF